ncbi:MAG: hypothetical protein WA418_39595, partial [Bradyrhizobium sp.]
MADKKNLQTASSRNDLYRHVSVLALMSALAITALPHQANALATSATTNAAAQAAQNAAAKAAAA